ncbi:MAG: hypothetical protein IH596_00465 [Bacteroidales bacterium]|nr:hypothetical protein [Bacteroidales bacterium]
MSLHIRHLKILFLPLLLTCSLTGFAEGTKQLMPVDGGSEQAHITAPAVQQYGFAWLNCPEDNRLNIHVKEVGEKIYYGFRKTQVQNRTFQIRDPNGNIVFGMNMPPAGDTGYIATHVQAVAGPSQIAGPTGYDALLYIPTMAGDYSIEFQANCTLMYFDITVTDSLDEPIDGRIWSKAWQFSTGTAPGEFNGSLFVYSDDGIVTNLDLNGMQGIVFTVACNQFGCPDPITPGAYTRKSVNGQHVIPQYKIFVSDPDTSVYPTGILGQISNMLITWQCDGTAAITFDVTVAATVDILLNINPLPGKQPEDVLITHNATIGTNTVFWNGMNGLTPAQPVPNSTVFDVIITYILGLTNFPVYDVEQNLNGYIVSLIRPTGPVPNLYWDDLDLVVDPLSNCGAYVPPDPTANYTGCPGNTGCHTWESVGPQPLNQCSYPNRNTANTWWYAVFSNSTLPNFEVHRIPFPTGDPTGTIDVCPGDQQITYTITAEENSTTYEWEYTGIGATFNPANPDSLIATLDFTTNATSGYIRVRGWNTNCGFGPWDSTFINVYPFPDVSNSPPFKEICEGQTTGLTLTSSVTGAAFTWSCTQTSGNVTGWIANPSLPSTIIDQTLLLTGFIQDSVIYHVTPLANGCTGDSSDITVYVNPVPALTVIPMTDSICSEALTNIPLTATCPGTDFSWISAQDVGSVTGNTNGSGSLINDQLTNPQTTPGSILYSITPATSSCTGNTEIFTMWVKPVPHLTNQPKGDSVCNGTSPAIILTSDVANTWFTWLATGSSFQITGFTDQTTPTALLDQTLTNSGFDLEWVTYQVVPSAAGCQGPDSTYIVTVFPTPDLFFIPPGETVCEGQPSGLSIQSHVTWATFTWTAVASSPNLSGYSNGSGDLITQTIGNAGATIETVTYQVTPAANGCQPGTTMPVILTVNPRPVVNASPGGQSLCYGETTGLTLMADVTGSTFGWRAFCSSGSVSGFTSGSGGIIAQSLVNSGFNIDTVTYRVAAAANGCAGDSTDVVVIVYPVADVIFVPNSDAICSGQTIGLSLQSQVTGATFTWTATGSSPDISGYGPGSGDMIQQTLYNSGYMPGWVTWQVAPTANGCLGTSNSAMVTVNSLPIVSMPNCFDTITTTQAQPIELRGVVPSGGTFTGAGITGSVLFPAVAGTGVHHIRYTYTNDFGCLDSASCAIHILDPVSFICGDTLTDIRDNKRYPTVDINDQCWMAANLNYGAQIPGSQSQRDNCVNEKYCYNDNPALCAQGSALYQWDELMNYEETPALQGLCPPGWHIPTETEWTTLFNQYINNGFAGNALKYPGYSGFNALVTGIRFHTTIWKYPVTDPVLRSILFWSSDAHSPSKAWAHGMNEVAIDFDYTPSVSLYPALRSNGFAVRCLKD